MNIISYTITHLLVPAAEGDVRDAGVLAGPEAADAEAGEDQGALPAGRLRVWGSVRGEISVYT